MSIFNFLKNSKDNENIIYTLDGLLQISIKGEAIHKRRNIDLSLYKILNSPEVNQEIIHLGCLPIIREYRKASKEFLHFVNNLSMYMEYDINLDSLWAKTANNPVAQNNIYQKMVSIRQELLDYLFEKKLISDEQYSDELNHKVKRLTD